MGGIPDGLFLLNGNTGKIDDCPVSQMTIEDLLSIGQKIEAGTHMVVKVLGYSEAMNIANSVHVEVRRFDSTRRA